MADVDDPDEAYLMACRDAIGENAGVVHENCRCSYQDGVWTCEDDCCDICRHMQQLVDEVG